MELSAQTTLAKIAHPIVLFVKTKRLACNATLVPTSKMENATSKVDFNK